MSRASLRAALTVLCLCGGVEIVDSYRVIVETRTFFMATIERIGEVRVREAGLKLLQPYIWRSRYGLQLRKELLAVQFYGVVVLR